MVSTCDVLSALILIHPCACMCLLACVDMSFGGHSDLGPNTAPSYAKRALPCACREQEKNPEPHTLCLLTVVCLFFFC